MNVLVKKKSDVDWALLGSILFWMIVIATSITLISSGHTEIPRPVLEIYEASASRENLIITHLNGDSVRFANTKCIWTPDISVPNVSQDGGSLLLAGDESKQGVISKFEPTEGAKLKKNIKMKEGNVGRLLIVDQKSGQQIFSQTVEISK